MKQTIYADVLFAVNFSMDFLALFLTGKILHTDSKTVRTAISAALGGVYAVSVLLMRSGRIIELFLNILAAALMCYICFLPSSKTALFKETLLFFGVNFLIGGCMTGICSFLDVSLGKKIVINGEAGVVYGGIGAAKFVPLALIAAALSVIIGRIFSSSARRKEVDAVFVYGNSKLTLRCLADSGDLLCEPVGGLPVIVTSYDAVKTLIPDRLRPLFKSGDVSELAKIPPGLAGKVRVIPVDTAAGDSLIIPGFVPDGIIVGGESKKGCIGVYSRSEHDYGGCAGIIPFSLI